MELRSKSRRAKLWHEVKHKKPPKKNTEKRTRGDRITWTTKFKPTELAEIDAVIKLRGKTRAGFIRWAVGKFKEENNFDITSK